MYVYIYISFSLHSAYVIDSLRFCFCPARTASRGRGVRGASQVGGISSNHLAEPGRGILIYLFYIYFIFILFIYLEDNPQV